MQQQPQERIGWRESGELALTLLYSFALTSRLCLAMFIRRGFGSQAFDPYGVFAFFFMLTLACMDKALWYVFLLWFGALVCQRIYTLRQHLKGNRQHSRYQGDPWLATKLFKSKSDEEAFKMEPIVCALAGGVAFVFNEPLGMFIGFGFVSFGVCMALEAYMRRVTDQRMFDAEAEMDRDGRRFRGR